MTKPAGQTIFNKYFILLFATSVCFCFSSEMLNVVLPLYVTEDLGRTAAVSGLMTTFYTVASAVSRPFNGILTDKLTRRIVMAVGCALYAIGIFLCGFIPMLVTAFCCRMLQGIGYSAASTSNMAASNDVIPKDRLNEGVGYFGMSHSLPGLFAPVVVTTLITAIGNRGTQYVIAAVCAVATVLALLANYEKKPECARAAPVEAKSKGAFIEPTALGPSILQFFSLFFTSGIMVFITLFFKAQGLSNTHLSVYLTVSCVTILLVRTLLSRFVGKVSPIFLMVPAWILAIVQCLTLPRVTTIPGCALMAVCFGCVHGVPWMTNGALAVSRAAPQRRGSANATFYLAFDAAIGIGAAVWGVFIDGLGYVPTYRILACGFALVAIAAILVYRKWKPAE